jgi:prepilin signal peptidase PulO-like enzyme (type II secretory pathway)
VYLLFLIFSISFIDADTPLDNRILSAIVMPLIVVFSVVASSLARIQPRVLIRIFAFLVLLFILFRQGRTLFHDVRRRQSAEDLAWFPSLQSDTLDASFPRKTSTKMACC